MEATGSVQLANPRFTHSKPALHQRWCSPQISKEGLYLPFSWLFRPLRLKFRTAAVNERSRFLAKQPKVPQSTAVIPGEGAERRHGTSSKIEASRPRPDNQVNIRMAQQQVLHRLITSCLGDLSLIQRRDSASEACQRFLKKSAGEDRVNRPIDA